MQKRIRFSFFERVVSPIGPGGSNFEACRGGNAAKEDPRKRPRDDRRDIAAPIGIGLSLADSDGGEAIAAGTIQETRGRG